MWSWASLLSMKINENCEICYQIICKRCGWKACEGDVLKIQKGEMTVCPECGWKPGDAI